MAYQLNQRSFEKASAAIAAGMFTDASAFAFTPDDGNKLLGDDENNWMAFSEVHLGIDRTADQSTKPAYAYPFAKQDGVLNLAALRSIQKSASQTDRGIADAAGKLLKAAGVKMKQRTTASGANQSTIIAMTARCTIQAASDGDTKKTPTFSMMAYSGGPMRLEGWSYPVTVDLAGVSGSEKSRPILMSHDPAQVVGHTTGISVDKSGITAEGIISGTGPAAQEVVANSKNGFPWMASIGARPTKTEFVPEGKSASVNGRTVTGPASIARKTELHEISIVAIGADENSCASIAATKTLPKRKFKMNDENDNVGIDDPIQAERHRVAGLHRIAAKYPAVPAQQREKILASAVADGWDGDKCELELIRAERPQHRISNLPASADPGTADVIHASACLGAGISPKFLEKHYDKRAIDAAMSKPNRITSIRQLMTMTLQCAGFHAPTGNFTDEDIRATFVADRRLSEDRYIQAAGGGYSTMSLSGITENILNKALMESYQSVDALTPQIAFETDTNDFKPFKRYRLTLAGIMAAVGPVGELKNVSLQDESYPNQVGTQGVLLTIGRDVLINDDMGALTQGPSLLGRASNISREMAVFAALLGATGVVAPGASLNKTANNFNFFSAGAANYLSGAGSVLQVSSVTTALQKMREQVDANFIPVMLNPDRIIVPPALEATGLNLFSGAELVVSALASTSAKNLEPNANVFKGRFTTLVSPFLSAAVATNLQKNKTSYPNGSDTCWLLMGNPSGGMAPVMVGYLRGQRTPIIERGEANFNTLGIAMRCYFDFGVALHDYRTAVWSAGA